MFLYYVYIVDCWFFVLLIVLYGLLSNLLRNTAPCKFQVQTSMYIEIDSMSTLGLTSAEVQHRFMSEITAFKQKFLLDVFNDKMFDQCCLYADATKVFSDERQCLRHAPASGQCECESNLCLVLYVCM